MTNKTLFITLLLLLVAVTPVFPQNSFGDQLAGAALELTRQQVRYDPAYYTIPYPGGDIPADRGVCTDVVIRAYRLLDIDLQKEVHEDMKHNFDKYPNNWGLKRPDKNIDHRRVPNLMVFFRRYGEELSRSTRREDYLPGDIVCWMLPGNLTHIGIVADKKNSSGCPLIVHNIGGGQVLEDCLFSFDLIGHFRYSPKK